MLFDQPTAKLLQTVLHPTCTAQGVDLRVLRLDQTDAQVSGNKWYKLKYNLLHAKAQGYKTVLSFGGAYSNHIHALAWAGQALGLQTWGIIRGEAAYASNPTLSDAQGWGMQLQFVERAAYRQRQNPDQIQRWLDAIPDHFKPALVVPEGGSNHLAVKGCVEIIDAQVLSSFTPELVVLPCGTGGTLAGVALSLAQQNAEVQVLGIPVLKNAGFLYQDITQLIEEASDVTVDNWDLDLEGHYGGYAKGSSALYALMQQMEAEYKLPLDQVYTAKMMLRLLELIAQGQFNGKKILALHTGGLQGRRTLA